MRLSDGLLTSELLRKLDWITEDQLRSAVRRGKLKPEQLPNRLFVWPPKEVKKAEKLFEWRKKGK